MKRILIISGGSISSGFTDTFLKKWNYDIMIAADRGLKIVEDLQLPVDYILGDFDSVPSSTLEKYKRLAVKQNIKLKEYPPEKDKTDTQIAVELAIKLQADEIVLLGATGTRIDHLLANIHLLYIPLLQNKKAYIIDEHNKIYLINKDTVLDKDQLYGPNLSLLPFTEKVAGVTLEGFKYPLSKVDMHIGESLGISNVVIDAKAHIRLESGIFIVIESKD